MAPIATRDIELVNGHVEELKEAPVKVSSDSYAVPCVEPSADEALVLKTFRLLIADLCQQFGGGHGGSAIGMAAIGVALWKHVMRYAPNAPNAPNFFDRDRFVLSNGHACLFQYVFLHLTGYEAMTLDQLKSYHSSRVDTLCPGHPEIEIEGIEVTTGPLGQGVGNAVGMAIATKHLASTYNRPTAGFRLISNHTWCMVGDACLQEGVALEAISLAGHLKLNNLTMIYDKNQVTCDGSVDLANTEDVNLKMRATGWDVIDVLDGCFNVAGLVSAMMQAKSSRERPTFINMKRESGFDPEAHFVIPTSVKGYFADAVQRGHQVVQEWQQQFEKYQARYPEVAGQLEIRLKGELSHDWKSHIPASFPAQPIATRVSSGLAFKPVAENIASFLVGSRYIRYGIREHAMVAIANGLAAYHPGLIVPVTSSFLVFYLYAAAAVRTGALQRLQVIHLTTHDSIGMGEGGPTHQPIEVAALFRAMPNLLYIRPGDSEETAGAWIAAIEARHTPSVISTSRHKLPQLVPKTSRSGVAKGAYVLEDSEKADVTIIGVGAELCLAIEVASELRDVFNLKVRTVSFPCYRLFERQPLQYRHDVLQRHLGIPAVVIEAYAALGWERYADAAICMRTDRFGQSLPSKEAYRFFGFESGSVSKKVVDYLNKTQRQGLVHGDFVEL